MSIEYSKKGNSRVVDILFHNISAIEETDLRYNESKVDAF